MELESVQRLTRDLREASKMLSDRQARYLVDAYYQMQDDRKRDCNQVLAMTNDEEPAGIIAWLGTQSSVLEKQVARALDAYSGANELGLWARSVVGIGPIIAAGLLAHIDIKRAPTAGHIWSFAGLDPTVKWKNGERRPWNAKLKVLCWKIGESFVKVKGRDDDVYGHFYEQRRKQEGERNEAGLFADQAARVLEECPKHKQAATYRKGKLPDGHLHARAKRYAVKLFLAHYHDKAYRLHFGTAPPLPYPIAHLGHVHMIEP